MVAILERRAIADLGPWFHDLQLRAAGFVVLARRGEETRLCARGARSDRDEHETAFAGTRATAARLAAGEGHP